MSRTTIETPRPLGGAAAAGSAAAVTARIARRDLMPAGAYITTALSPLRTPERGQVVERLLQLMRLGPSARVGRTIEQRRWRYDPAVLADLADRMVRPMPASTETATLPSLRTHLEPGVGATVFLGDDVGALVIDHRLGDGALATLLVAALLGDRELPTAFAAAASDDPLRPALRETFGGRRGRVAELLRERAEAPHRAARDPRTVPGRPERLDLVTGTMPLATFKAFSAHVRGHAPSTVAMLFALRGALRTAGIPTLDDGVMLVNLRRYLPSDATTLGNFVTGLPVPLDIGWQVAGPRVTRQLRVGRPLAAHAVGLLTSRVSGDATGDAPAAATPVISDMGLFRSFEPLPWTGPEKTIAMSVDPAARNGVTALVGVLGGRLNVSLSFDGSLFARSDVARACELLCSDPMGMIDR